MATTVTVTATATAASNPTSNPTQLTSPSPGGARTGVSYGFIALIIVLGLLLILSLACVGHGFWDRRRARRRGEDPGPLFGRWCWQRRNSDNNNNSNTQPVSTGQGPVIGAGADARGKEFYNVVDGPSAVGMSAMEMDLKGGSDGGMARYA